MKLIIKIFKILMIVVGAFFIVMAFDVFEIEGTFWEKLGGFFISISPGLVLILLVSFFWNNEIVLGIGFIPLSIFLTILFNVFEDMPEHLMTLTITGPIFVAGILFIIYGIKTKREE